MRMPMGSMLAPVVFFAVIATAASAADWQTLPDRAPSPADNPTTPAKVELGKMLYFDPRLPPTPGDMPE